MARICAECKKAAKPGKGATLHYYKGSIPEAYFLCSTPCIDTLKAKKAAQGYGRPGVR